MAEAEFSPADAHGQYRFNYRHEHIPAGQEQAFLLDAFQQDFAVNGPSLARLIRTTLKGWQRYGKHSDPRVRRRFARDETPLSTSYAGAVWAMRRHYRKDDRMRRELDRLLSDLFATFGVKTRLAAPLIGIYLFAKLRREQQRLAAGWVYEPATFCEKNAAARALDRSAARSAAKYGEKLGKPRHAIA